DIPFVFAWVLYFTILRELVMRLLFTPLARFCGIQAPGKQLRFAEQGWILVYPVCSWSLGLYIMQTSPWKNFNTREYWDRYPYDKLPWLQKWYYLVQTGFWIQQLIVLNMEKKRKDYPHMLLHHIITITLLSLSYCCNITPVGNAILVCMDLCDIFLPAAKLFRYANLRTLCDAFFAIFAVSWVLTRHVLYGRLLYSAVIEAKQRIPYEWDPARAYFFNSSVHRIFSGLLIFLQVLLLGWLYFLVVAVKKAITGEGLEDVRSDDEEYVSLYCLLRISFVSWHRLTSVFTVRRMKKRKWSVNRRNQRARKLSSLLQLGDKELRPSYEREERSLDDDYCSCRRGLLGCCFAVRVWVCIN
ncbi:LAG1-domain-containing protein, partial [Atractiella rhizophila]